MGNLSTPPLYIITGASRGLGFEIARQLLATPCHMLTLARHENTALTQAAATQAAAINGTTLTPWIVDLAQGDHCAARLDTWLRKRTPSTATLINNAGVIDGVGPIDTLDPEALRTTLRINLEAPLQLTAAFLRATATWRTTRKVLNISSGAGRHAIAGWSAYCASKAGLDHFSRVTALDEARKPHGAKIVALAPGVIDTDMQAQLRAADATGFPDQSRFIQLHASGQLTSPQHAAAQVLNFLSRPDFGAEPIADVRHDY